MLLIVELRQLIKPFTTNTTLMFSPIKYLGIFSGFFLLALCMACGQANNMAETQEESKPVIMKVQGNMDMKGFAVLELFTSEGCSSCPPADRLLRDVIEDSQEKGLDVYALSFHVDYWNRLGWKDPYSSSAYSDRQRTYARALNSNVYTPQLVVNGKDEFVGSNRTKAAMSIKKALNSPLQDITIDFEAKIMGNSLSYRYKTEGKLTGTILNVALVESGLSQNVSRGENRGKILRHDNVVRAFETVEIDAMMGRGRLSVPEDINREHARIILYAQNKGSKEVVLAKAIELGKTEMTLDEK